jgi:aspartate-semialdehyde dehydrogenase
MKKVGLIGWRGMVGSVLLERMVAERDFDLVETHFFSTSQTGALGPNVAGPARPLLDANDIGALADFDILITCQGGDYTSAVYPKLRDRGWKGYWIDAASTLRMSDEAIIILDPVNRAVIDEGLAKGVRTFVGGNCTVSLMLMGLQGLFARGWVEWMTSMTYQAASGAGAQNMRELVNQMATIGEHAGELARDSGGSILELDRKVSDLLSQPSFPTQAFGAPLAGSLIAWIDKAMPNGQSREEWKAEVEANKILGTKSPIRIDGTCVRVGAMRCHSQGLTIKLNRDLPLAEIEAAIAGANDWVEVVPNDIAATKARLSPAAVSGKLTIPVGRIRKMTLGGEFINAFTCGDQLLWGAAEPLRRMLRILVESPVK